MGWGEEESRSHTRTLMPLAVLCMCLAFWACMHGIGVHRPWSTRILGIPTRRDPTWYRYSCTYSCTAVRYMYRRLY